MVEDEKDDRWIHDWSRKRGLASLLYNDPELGHPSARDNKFIKKIAYIYTYIYILLASLLV